VGGWKDTQVRLFKVQQDRSLEGLREIARDMSAHKVDQMATGVDSSIGILGDYGTSASSSLRCLGYISAVNESDSPSTES